jgi:hypothetical protein
MGYSWNEMPQVRTCLLEIENTAGGEFLGPLFYDMLTGLWLRSRTCNWRSRTISVGVTELQIGKQLTL